MEIASELRSAVSWLAVALLAACAAAQPHILPPALTPARPAKRLVVNPSQSIQAAIDAAAPGDTIVVEPGTYRERGRPCPFDAMQTCAVVIAKDRISLVAQSGKRPIVLANGRGLANGIGVGAAPPCASRVRGSRIVGFVVKGFAKSGIALTCDEYSEIAYDALRDDELYGISTTYSRFDRLHDDVAQGARRAGIHIALSSDVRANRDIATGNVIGMEVRETVRTALDGDIATGNTAGIFESIMPGDPLERSHDNTLTGNLVQRNNAPNRCMKGDPECLVAPGVGIVVIGGARNANVRNRSIGNQTFGIAVIDVCTAFQIPAGRCAKLKFDPLPRQTRTINNVSRQNGTDLLWTQNGSGNCWRKNRAKVRVPGSLPPCGESLRP